MRPSDLPDVATRRCEPARIGAVVLAGGRGRRLGRDKASLRIGEVPALTRICRAVEPVAEVIVVAARQAQDLPDLPERVAVARDPVADCGPLAGMLAGSMVLSDLGLDVALVVACDHPLVATKLLEALADRLATARAVAVRHGERIFPLLAGYRLDRMAALAEAVEKRRLRVQSFLEACQPAFLEGEALLAADPDLRSLINVNDQAQLDEALTVLGRTPSTPAKRSKDAGTQPNHPVRLD